MTDESLPEVWRELLPMLQRALRHGEGDSTTADHVFAQVIRGDMVVWAVHNGPEIIAGLFLSIKTYPAKKTLVIEFLAGRDLDLWADRAQALLVEFKELIGADTIECSCRAGLAHRLKKRGWTRKAIIMELKQ